MAITKKPKDNNSHKYESKNTLSVSDTPHLEFTEFTSKHHAGNFKKIAKIIAKNCV